MTLNIDITPEMEEQLSAQAAARGLALPDYLRRILEEQLSSSRQEARTPADRAALWRDSVVGLPVTAPLSDEAVSREHMYDMRV